MRYLGNYVGGKRNVKEIAKEALSAYLEMLLAPPTFETFQGPTTLSKKTKILSTLLWDELFYNSNSYQGPRWE